MSRSYYSTHRKLKVGEITIFSICFINLLLILLPLFIHHSFYIDWENHVWLINVFKSHFMQSMDFPIIINAKSASGNPLPLFYGFLFYPFLAIFSLFLDADTGVRCAAASLITAHLALIYLLSRKTMSRPASLCVATVAVTSIYQLTNLYSRSALTEFFSYEFFAIAFPLALLSLWDAGRIKLRMFTSAVGLLILATGMHPPTAYAAALLVAPIALVFLTVLMSGGFLRLRLGHGIVLAGACCVLAPWVYLVWRYNTQLAINSNPDQTPGLAYLPTTIDSIYGKLGWLYIDRRTLADGIAATSTPFLNASLQMPLALACLALVIIVWASLTMSLRFGIIAAILLCAITVDLSLRPRGILLVSSASPYFKILPRGVSVLHDLVEPLQFAYRLTNTLSLQLTVLLTMLLYSLQSLRLTIGARYLLNPARDFGTRIACRG